MANTNIVNALAGIRPNTGGQGMKILVEFGDNPEILEAIVEARKRRCSYRQISMALSQDGKKISQNAVQNYLTSIGMS